MKPKSTKILFFHGLDSSKASTKFHAISSPNKFCIDVDYRNLTFNSVLEFYHHTIHKIKPNLLVGHGIGGYWALKMSYLFQLPAIIANPCLQPNFRTDYLSISETDLDHEIPQLAYLELGDETLNMVETRNFLEHFMFIEVNPGGYHRLEYPERLNQLIQFFETNYLLDRN